MIQSISNHLGLQGKLDLILLGDILPASGSEVFQQTSFGHVFCDNLQRRSVQNYAFQTN